MARRMHLLCAAVTDGASTAELAELVAAHFGVKATNVEVKTAKGRNKIVQVQVPAGE